MPLHIEKEFEVLLEFELQAVFGEKFFPPMREPEKAKMELALLFSHIRIGLTAPTDLAFEIHRHCGIKKFFICGYTAKWHLEEVLAGLRDLGFETYLIADLLSIMDEPSLNPYLLRLKSEYGINLCLAVDCIPSIFSRPLPETDDEKISYEPETEEE